jgi:hypothetical protein
MPFMISITTPSVTTREGFLFYYPIYEPVWLQNSYTLGGYFWIFFYAWLIQNNLNSDFGGTFYKFMNDCSMWAYVSHYMWIVLINHFIVRKYNLTFLSAGPLSLFGTMFLIPASYVLLMKVKDLISPPKSKK